MLCLMLVLTVIQTYQGRLATSDGAEQQRPRLSLRIHLEQIDDPAGGESILQDSVATVFLRECSSAPRISSLWSFSDTDSLSVAS